MVFSFSRLVKQALTDLRVPGGKRPDRRRWREEGGERVAGVGEGRRRTAAVDIRRAPQQGVGSISETPRVQALATDDWFGGTYAGSEASRCPAFHNQQCEPI